MNALIAAKVGRVVVAVVDPDTRVDSKGLGMLREAGIEVETGVLVEEVSRSMQAYLHHRRTGLPWCVGKIALSIDSKVACQDNTSKWITGPAARADAHLLRASSQAIMVGSSTAKHDDPRLTIRVASDELDHELRLRTQVHDNNHLD